MAKDLLLGKTSRDWSVGQFFMTEARRRQAGQDVLASSQVGPLARQVDGEMQSDYRKIVELQVSGKILPDERRAFGALLRKWQEFSLPKVGKFEGSDFLALQNFRDAAVLWGKRLAEYEKRPVHTAPFAPASAPSSSPGYPILRLTLLNLAIGVAGLYGMSRVVKLAEHRRGLLPEKI